MPDAQSLPYLRLALLAAVSICLLFDLIYLFQGRYNQLAITASLSIVFPICLWLLQQSRYAWLAIGIAFFVSTTAASLTILLEPATSYWLCVVTFAMLLVLGKRAFGWIAYMFLLIAAGMTLDLSHHMTSLHALDWINLILSLVVLIFLFYHYLHFVEAQQKAVAEYSARLSEKKAVLERMEQARMIAGGIAHLINNEMQGITTRSFLLKHKLPEALYPQLDQLTDCALKASSHANQLLTYAGHLHGRLQPVCLNHLLQQLRPGWENGQTPQLQTSIEFPDEELYCEGEEMLLRQALEALFDNAREACGEEGNIRIVLQKTGEGHAAHAMLTIHDDGEGMSQQTLAHIFEPFFTTRFTGRGLGLAAASGVARIHHGELHIESEKGVGTLATLRLPLLQMPDVGLPETTPTH